MNDAKGSQRAERAAWVAAECRRAAFAEVVRAAATIGAPVLPVKGALTAWLFYERPEDRPMVDVDVRVRPCDLARLVACGEARGWTLLERSASYQCAALEVHGERVELESHVGPPGYCGLTIERMAARASRHVEPFGVPHLQPELHDHALVMMVNAFKDQLVRAGDGGLTDLARMAASPAFSFERLALLARDAKVASLAWLVGAWMIEERGEAGWRALHRALGGRPTRPAWVAAFRALARKERPPSLPLRLLVRAAPDTKRMQARALAVTLAWWIETWRASPARALARIT